MKKFYHIVENNLSVDHKFIVNKDNKQKVFEDNYSEEEESNEELNDDETDEELNDDETDEENDSDEELKDDETDQENESEEELNDEESDEELNDNLNINIKKSNSNNKIINYDYESSDSDNQYESDSSSDDEEIKELYLKKLINNTIKKIESDDKNKTVLYIKIKDLKIVKMK